MKVDVPNSITHLTRTPVLKWYVVWCSYKNGHQKDVCLKECRLGGKFMMIILGSGVTITGVGFTIF